MRIFHLVGRDDWESAVRAGVYRAPSLEREGFIHFSTQEQLVGSAERYFAGRDDVLVLTVRTAALGSALRFAGRGRAPTRFHDQRHVLRST